MQCSNTIGVGVARGTELLWRVVEVCLRRMPHGVCQISVSACYAVLCVSASGRLEPFSYSTANQQLVLLLVPCRNSGTCW